MVEASTPESAAPAEPPEETAAPPEEPAAPATPGQAAGRRVMPRHRIGMIFVLLFHGGLAFWMAWLRGPYDPYFYDEKFNMENVVQIVTTHGIEPANGWYSLLSYLPQALVAVAMDELHQRTGHHWLLVIDPVATPPLIATFNVFLAARLLGILYGSLSLCLVFWLGTRLFSPATGLLGALALAVSPWMIRTSVEFKPDALLLLATLLAILWMVRFFEKPTLGRFLWVGAGLGLAATAKLNGSFIGPLVALAGIAGALLAEPRGFKSWLRRVAGWGTAAAGLAAAVFFATSPYFGLMLSYIGRIERFYGQRAGHATPEDVALQAAADLPSAVFLGPAIWALALFGALVVLARLFEKGAPASLKLSRLLLVFFPLVYGTVLAFTMRYYKQNNLVQLLPFFALLAAVALTTLGSLTERWPRWFGRAVATLAVLAFLAHSAWLALSFSYEENVPYDWQVLSERLRVSARIESPRVVVYEGSYETMPSYKWGRADGAILGPSVRWLDDAETLYREQLDLADVVVLSKDLGGPQRSAFLAALRTAVPPDAVGQIEPYPLRVRGPGFETISHEWQLRDGAAALACKNTPDPTLFHCRLPADFLAGEVATLHFAFWSKKVGVAEILIGGEDGERVESLFAADLGEGQGWEAMSERFVVPGPGTPILLRFEMPIEGPLAGAVPVELRRWLPPAGVRLEIPPPFKSPFAKAKTSAPPVPKAPAPAPPPVAEPAPAEPPPANAEEPAPAPAEPPPASEEPPAQ